jgi:hypothetical protein
MECVEQFLDELATEDATEHADGQAAE